MKKEPRYAVAPFVLNLLSAGGCSTTIFNDSTNPWLPHRIADTNSLGKGVGSKREGNNAHHRNSTVCIVPYSTL